MLRWAIPGGAPVGSYLFDIELESWKKIGNNVLAQAWHNGNLYQANSSLIRRNPSESWQRVEVSPSICQRHASSLSMKVINNEIWITGDARSSGKTNADESGCGVMRYNTTSRQMADYNNKDGLNHIKGWDLAGDSKAVFVTHSVKHNKLSYFDFNRESWFSMRTGGSGNVIALTHKAIWLAQGTPRRPLRRIDRQNYQGKSFSAFSDSEYVSAIGVNHDEVWLGIYQKHWSKGNYTITSKLGVYYDK